MYNYKKFDKKSFDETEEDRVSGAWIIFKDFTIKLFPPEFSWEGIDTSEIVAKGRYEKYGEKHITSLSTFLDQFNLQGEAKGKINRKINEILSSNFNNLKIMIDKMGSSYNFKKQARQGLPEMNDPAYDPYKKNKPGDQDGGEGVSYRSSPGSTGFGSDDTNTKGPKGVDIGRGEDSERSEMLDLLSPTDGEDPVKNNGGRVPGSSESGQGQDNAGSQPWFDDSFPESSDKYDESPGMITRMDSTHLYRSVFDELTSRRKQR